MKNKFSIVGLLTIMSILVVATTTLSTAYAQDPAPDIGVEYEIPTQSLSPSLSPTEVEEGDPSNSTLPITDDSSIIE